MPQKVGQIGSMSVAGSQQQDLRPRSSDGILQRITVDRGPATGEKRHNFMLVMLMPLSLLILSSVLVLMSDPMQIVQCISFADHNAA